MIGGFLKIFFISMLPLIELRGAIPVSRLMDLPLIPSFLICIAGNLLPMPFIYKFARGILEWGRDKRGIGKFCTWCIEKGHKASKKLTKKKAGREGLFWALVFFVGIPIPGTGAWTGILAASFLEMGWKRAFLAVSIGVLMAGAIMAIASSWV
ncbi:small multi-drug export protein [Candidatus Saccharibacteria bacterium]|nr:small multi-drug export protein [Candidatus Saccharibacteria bacterium]